MKKILSFVMVAVLAVMLAGCNKYDDSELQRRVGELEKSMQQLLNYQTLLQKLAAGNTVTAYTTTTDGYKLTFSDGNSIEFNSQGPKGDPGKPLTWDDLTQAQKDALKGAQGENGKTPKFKIENETWKVSYDEGATWSDVGSAIDRSLIENIVTSEDGKILLITLAGGTVIPVAYGEKETVGFKLLRHGVTRYESLDWLLRKDMKVPFQLTGDAGSIDNIKFMFNIHNKFGKYVDEPELSVEATGEKTGNIVIKQNSPVFPHPESGHPAFEDFMFYMDYPPYDVDVTAYFPDGTAGCDTFSILGDTLMLQTFEDDWDSWLYNDEESGSGVYIDIPANAGSQRLRVSHAIYGLSKYDGPTLTAFNPADLFEVKCLDIMFDSYGWGETFIDETYINYNYIEVVYTLYLDYKENTTSKIRKTGVGISALTEDYPDFFASIVFCQAAKE